MIGNTGTFGSDLVVDTSTLKVDSTNNRVGIGKTNPAKTLDIAGTLAVSGITTLANDLAIDTNVFVVDTSGNKVGIGKTNPQTALDVAGTISADTLTDGTSSVSGGAYTGLTSIVVDSLKLDSNQIGPTNDSDLIKLSANSVRVSGDMQVDGVIKLSLIHI